MTATRAKPLVGIGFALLLLCPARLPAGSRACAGDCDELGTISFDEIVTAVQLALEDPAATACASTDVDGNSAITVEELVVAVGNGSAGCPLENTPTQSVTATPTSTPTITPTMTLTPLPTLTPVPGVPFVRVAPGQIPNSGTTTLTIAIDPNGAALAAFTIVFRLDPTAVHLLAVTGLHGASASGDVGGDAFSFAIAFGVDQTTPLDVGTVQIQGILLGGAVQLTRQIYTDGEFDETVIETITVVATVVAAN